MFLEDSFNLGRVDAPDKNAAVGGSDSYILTVGTEGSAGPIASYLKSLVTAKECHIVIIEHLLTSSCEAYHHRYANSDVIPDTHELQSFCNY